MNRTRYGVGLGLAGLLATVCLGLPQSAHAQGKGQGKFTAGLENAIDQIVHLIGTGVQEDLPAKESKGLDKALQQLLRVFEAGPPGQHHGHHHHHQGHGLGMGARQAGGDAGNQKGPAQAKGSRGHFDQGAKCLCDCMKPDTDNKQQTRTNQPADPKAGQPVAGNRQPANLKAGQPVAGKTPAINQGIKMEPGMVYILGKPHAAKLPGPTNVTLLAAAKNGPTPARQPVAKTAAKTGAAPTNAKPAPVAMNLPVAKTVTKHSGQPFASAGKQTAARTANSAPTHRQSQARIRGNRQMLSSPWNVSSQHSSKH